MFASVRTSVRALLLALALAVHATSAAADPPHPPAHTAAGAAVPDRDADQLDGVLVAAAVVGVVVVLAWVCSRVSDNRSAL
jgi:H+/gluconate symporter-like permease